MNSNQPKPASTAEEQMLPPYVVTEDDKSKASQMLPNPLNTALMSRERQLTAALRSNREKDAQLAEVIEQREEQFNDILKARGIIAEKDAKILLLLYKIAELERWKNEALEAMREKEEWRSKFNNEAVVMGYAGTHYLESAYLIALRCEAAEASLRAVSEAVTRYYSEGRVDCLLARIRAIVEGK